jgi:putative SOS response-associated peptidase YedK
VEFAAGGGRSLPRPAAARSVVRKDMCGRYRLKNLDAVKAYLRQLFGASASFDPFAAPRYNLAPGQELPVLAVDAQGRAEIAAMRWGFVPFWEKSEKPKAAPINARAEDVLARPMFQQPIQSRRCLVPADGFYEWRKLGENLRQPFNIQLRGEKPFFMAAIHELGTANRPETFAVVTTRPNRLMARIHERMPAILSAERARRWLTPGLLDGEELRALTEPYPAEEMEAWPVSELVNHPRNDSPECLAPVAELPPAPEQALLF